MGQLLLLFPVIVPVIVPPIAPFYRQSVLVSNEPSFTVTYFDCSANCNTRGAFVIIFLIRSDLLNCLKSVGTIVITTENG